MFIPAASSSGLQSSPSPWHIDHRAHRPPCTPDIAIADIAIADIAIARLPPSGKPRAGQS